MYGRLHASQQRPTKAVPRCNGFPPATAWDQHRDEIKRLYLREDMRLDDVVDYMKLHHGFEATYDTRVMLLQDPVCADLLTSKPMYKKRFKAWDIHKYRTDVTIANLSRAPDTSSDEGNPSTGLDVRRPLKREISGVSNDGDSKEELRQENGMVKRPRANARLSIDCDLVAPPKPVRSYTKQVSPRKSSVTSMNKRSSSTDSDLSNSGVTTIFTPSSSEGTIRSQPPMPSSDHGQDRFPDNMSVPAITTDRHAGFGPNAWDWTGQTSSDGGSGNTDKLRTLGIRSEAARNSNPGSFSPDAAFNGQFHMLMGAPSVQPEISRSAVYSRLIRDPLEPSSALGTAPEPLTYVSLCYLSCIHQGQGRTEEAMLVASHAAQIYGTLARQQHEQALVCLNLVLAVLFYHGQAEFAAWLLQDALVASLRYLDESDNFIVIVRFLISQASSTTKKCGVSLEDLERIQKEYKHRRGPKDPYTLIAGYHLAWRLSLEDKSANLVAYRMLSSSQPSVDGVFRRTHMQAIMNLTTTARVLQTLERHGEAERVMQEALTRIDQVYPPFHPYSLENKRRHAELLQGVNQHALAERKLIEVAVSRVEVLGANNRLSRRSVTLVEETLGVSGRETELAKFRVSVSLALRNASTRTPEFDF